METLTIQAAAAHVRALRRAGLGTSARQAAHEARMRVGAMLLQACVA